MRRDGGLGAEIENEVRCVSESEFGAREFEGEEIWKYKARRFSNIEEQEAKGCRRGVSGGIGGRERKKGTGLVFFGRVLWFGIKILGERGNRGDGFSFRGG